MKNKIFNLFGFAIVALLVLTSFASATVTFSNIPTLSQSGSSFVITVTSDVVAGEDISFNATTITDPNGRTITFSAVPASAFVANTSRNITIPYTIQSGFNFAMKVYTTTLTADAETSSDITQSLSFEQTDFCAWDGNGLTSSTGDLEVTIKDIQVTSGFGEDNEWYPEDEIEVQVRIENNNNDYKIRNIVLEWGIFNKKTGDWTIDVSDENDFDLKKSDEKTLTLSFKLDNMDEDFNELDGGNLVFYARATGEVDDDASGYDVCSSDSEDVSITLESDFVILSDIQLAEPATSCGNQVQLTADIWNIGDEDQDDVYVVIYNKELGINQKVVLGSIDAFDNVKLNELIQIPQNAEEKTYTLALWVYNEDNEVYTNDNDDDSTFNIQLKVEGGCSNLPLVSISANLESEAKAGQELIIQATITNTGSLKKTFNLELNGYEEWASLVSIDKTSLELNSKATGNILITLKVNSDASGKQNFNILAKEGTKVLTQPVTVTIEGKPSFLSGLTGLVTSNGDNNWYLWGIGALNVVLVLVIIFVTIRVIRKK